MDIPSFLTEIGGKKTLNDEPYESQKMDPLV